MKQRVLFVCTHNSARSQMAEAYLRDMAGDAFEVESAGMDPMPMNPLAVEAMAEEGLDISGQQPTSVFDLYRQGRLYQHVITVCDQGQEARCPVFPGVTHRLHWPFDDPAELKGGHDQRLAGVRAIRGQIKARLKEWLADMDAQGAGE